MFSGIRKVRLSRRFAFCVLPFLALTPALSACQMAQDSSQPSLSADRSGEEKRIDSALERAAGQAVRSGNTQQSLAILERLYQRKPNDPEVAVSYARKLRESGYAHRASMVLSPLAREKSAPASVKAGFAAVQMELGNAALAEEYARAAIAENPDSWEAQHVLGIALDAKGDHKAAETAFRQSLASWEGDPTPVLNNLALNLAAQGYLDDAVDILRRTAEASPNRKELERNLKIISTLQQQQTAHPPEKKPSKKPDGAKEASGS